LQILGDEAERNDTKIGLENWRYPATPEEHLRLLTAVDHPAVGATLDVGHICYWFENEGTKGLMDAAAIADYQQRLHTFIDRIGPHIVHIHLHDVHPNPLRDHRKVGTGIIDFAPVMRQLQALNFDGVMLFELGELDQQQAQAASVKLLTRAMA
jgi:sugar phosphate isomerase/epimerase